MSDDVVEGLLAAAAAIGQSQVFFIAKEPIRPDFEPREQSHRIVTVNQTAQLCSHRDPASEFYLTALDFSWTAWACHEPCLHIGGDRPFLESFRLKYPRWKDENSPWYEPRGIPVCGSCGNWWRPGWGDWREEGWRCPPCQGDAAPDWKGTSNRTIGPEQMRELLEEAGSDQSDSG